MNYFEDDCIKSFHKMIEKLLKSNYNVYYKSISSKVLDILLSDDDTNKQLFFDYFKTVECDDKEKIVNTCSYDILSKVESIINNSSERKINNIIKYIRNLIDEQELIFYNTDAEKVQKIAEYIETFMLSIHDFLYNKKGNLNDKLKHKINNLNEYEKLALDSIVLNIMSIDFNEIKTIVNKDFVNTNDFIKLLDFYLPIYKVTYYLEKEETMEEDEYIKIYSINQVLKLLLNKQDAIARKVLSKTEIIYYLIYQFLINISLDESSKDYINKVILIVKDKLEIDDDTLNYLFEYYKNYHDMCSLEEQIKDIENLKNNNLNPLLNLYASFDIADYKKLEKKKQNFGLK